MERAGSRFDPLVLPRRFDPLTARADHHPGLPRVVGHGAEPRSAQGASNRPPGLDAERQKQSLRA